MRLEEIDAILQKILFSTRARLYVYSDSIHYPNRSFVWCSAIMVVVVEITKSGNVNEHSGTDSALFLVFIDLRLPMAQNIADTCESLPDPVLEQRRVFLLRWFSTIDNLKRSFFFSFVVYCVYYVLCRRALHTCVSPGHSVL